jgi:hypothetical protein
MDDFALTHPEAYDEDRLRLHEADFTPRPVVRQCLTYAYAFRGFNGDPEHAIDPAAGAGVWAKEMGRRWPNCTIAAIEAREEERQHLEHFADYVLIGDALAHAQSCSESGCFDLAATNPPFSMFREYVDEYLRVCRDVWLFAPIDANVRGEESSTWLRDNAKWVRGCLWVPGGIGFRGPGKTDKGKPNGQDHRQYGLWMLSSDKDEANLGSQSGWPVQILPRLPGADRRWVTRPGTEKEG